MNDRFENIEEMLRRNRVRPTAEERERVEQRVAAGGEPARPERAPRRVRAVPRLAFTAAAAVGALMLGAGTTFALTGTSNTPSAGIAQYAQPGTVSVLGETTPTGTSATSPTDATQTPTQTIEGVTTPQSPAQPTQQAAAGKKVVELPFTGLVIIPVLALGFVLLIGGMVMRGRIDRPES